MLLSRFLSSPVFWARYTFALDGCAGSERLGPVSDPLGAEHLVARVVFEVGGGHGITLSINTRVGGYELGITGPGSTKPAELGWDDLAHWHPYVFRWTELELICQAVAANDPQLSHPGAPMALLCRFAAIFDDDDVHRAEAVVTAAFAALRPQDWNGYWPTGSDWLARADFRGQKVTWHRGAAGMWAEQHDDHDADFYSTRVSPPAATDEHFPHARLKALLTAAAATTGTRPPS